MEIIENNKIHYSPIEYPHQEFDGKNYHIYFAYNIKKTVTGVENITVSVTRGEEPISVTAEHCTHPEMTQYGNIYLIHIVLSPYKFPKGGSCNRWVKVNGGWIVEELPIDIPISTQIIQIGCECEECYCTILDFEVDTPLC